MKNKKDKTSQSNWPALPPMGDIEDAVIQAQREYNDLRAKLTIDSDAEQIHPCRGSQAAS